GGLADRRQLARDAAQAGAWKAAVDATLERAQGLEDAIESEFLVHGGCRLPPGVVVVPGYYAHPEGAAGGTGSARRGAAPPFRPSIPACWLAARYLAIYA